LLHARNVSHGLYPGAGDASSILVVASPIRELPGFDLHRPLLLSLSEWTVCPALDALALDWGNRVLGCEKFLSPFTPQPIHSLPHAQCFDIGRCCRYDGGRADLSLSACVQPTAATADQMGRLR